MELKSSLNILIGLDLSEMDSILVSYAREIVQWLPVQKIVYLHNIKINELPGNLTSQDKIETLSRKVNNKLQQLVKELAPTGLPFEIVTRRAAFTELAFEETVKQHKIDLVILGNKQQLEGSGGINQKLARMLNCAVLLVPETFRGVPRKILLAVDFSRYTTGILQWGRLIEQLNMQHAGFKITPLYISKLAYHFFPFFSNEDVEQSYKIDMQEKQKKWQQHFAQYPKLEIIPAGDKNIASALMDYADQHRYDLLVLGVKGSSSLTTLFMGSVANELIQVETNICFLFVKGK